MKNKKNGMSVQSIIIGSVIRGIIRGSGISILWGSVDRRKITVEKQSIIRLNNGLNNLSYVMTDNVDLKDLKSNYQQLPNTLNYGTFSVKGTNPLNISTYNKINGSFVRYRDYTKREEVRHLKLVVKELNKFYDGLDSQNDNYDYLGKYLFNSNCSNYTDCWYRVKNHKIEQTGIVSPRGTIINTKDNNSKNVIQLLEENEKGNYNYGGWKVSYQKLN